MAPILLMTLLAVLSVVPFLTAYTLRWTFRLVGWYLQRKTQPIRELILERVKIDEEVYRKQRKTHIVPDDEDWEKVEAYSAGTAPNGEKASADWEGVVGFFHPFCNAGGGGERVLWAAIRATQQRWPKAVCVVYSGDHDIKRSTMVERVQSRFNITLHPPTLIFMYLSTRHLVLASTYPHFTLLGQSLGSLALGYDAFNLLVPDIFIDTMGYAFTLALCHYLFPSVPTAAYTHYPTISTDMLDSLDVTTGNRGVNAGQGTGTRGLVKRQYWHLFARLYGWVGGHIDVVMCNSSWTRAHITSLWKTKKSLSSFASVIYPPCPVEEFEKKITVSADSESQREPVLLYIAQFRPEKDHALILRSFARYLHNTSHKTVPAGSSDTTAPKVSSTELPTPRLVLIGSVRADTPDETHIYNLRLLAHELRIKDHTSFICDAPFSLILSYLQKASIGVNGMWNEHFGIGVVEYQAAGLIAVVHDSGGPKLDIVVPFEGQETGFRANNEEEFADGFAKVLEDMSDSDRAEMRLRARRNAKRFTEEVFARKWVAEMEELISLQVARSSAAKKRERTVQKKKTMMTTQK